MQLYTHQGTAGCKRKPFPPHGPHLVCAPTESSYVVQCLACSFLGPSVKTRWKRSRRLTKQRTRGQPLELIRRREWRGEFWEVHDPA